MMMQMPAWGTKYKSIFAIAAVSLWLTAALPISATGGSAFLELEAVGSDFAVGSEVDVNVVVRDAPVNLVNNAKVRLVADSGLEVLSILEGEGMLGLKGIVTSTTARIDVAKIQAYFEDDDVVAIVTVKVLSANNAVISLHPDSIIGSQIQSIDPDRNGLDLMEEEYVAEELPEESFPEPTPDEEPIEDEEIEDDENNGNPSEKSSSIISEIVAGLRGEGNAMYAYAFLGWILLLVLLFILLIYFLLSKRRSG